MKPRDTRCCPRLLLTLGVLLLGAPRVAWGPNVTALQEEADSDTASDPATDSDNDAPASTDSDNEAPASTDSDSDAQPATDSDSDAQPATDSDSDAQPATDSDSDAQSATDGDSDAAASTDSDSDAAASTDSDSDAAASTDSDSGAQPATDSDSGTQPATDSDSGAQTASDSDDTKPEANSDQATSDNSASTSDTPQAVAVDTPQAPESSALETAESETPETDDTKEEAEEVTNSTLIKEVEYGMCSATCGIGIRDVILLNGCPGGESKCIVRVEECRGPIDCGWGKPISESRESVRLACVHVFPLNRFIYVWKIIRPDQQPIVLSNDTVLLDVKREDRPLAFECDTYENNAIIASVRFTVYTASDLQMEKAKRPDTDAVLVFVLTVGVIICVFVIFVLIFIIINWAAVKAFWEAKSSSTEIHSDLSSTRYKDITSLDQSPTDIPAPEDDNLSEWNE